MPAVLVDLSQEQAHLLNVALNRISGTWDQELLARLLADLKDVPNVDLSLSGFDEDEPKRYLKGLETREKRERIESFDLDSALDEAWSAPVARTGDFGAWANTGWSVVTPPTAAMSCDCWETFAPPWPSPTRPTMLPTGPMVLRPSPAGGARFRTMTWGLGSTIFWCRPAGTCFPIPRAQYCR